MSEAVASGIRYSRIDSDDPGIADSGESGSSTAEPRRNDPKMTRRQEDEAFRGMRIFAYLLVPYFIAQGLSVLLWNPDRFVNPVAMGVSMAIVAALVLTLLALDRRHTARRSTDPNRSSYDLVLASVAALMVASLIQIHLVGSLNSFHLLLVLAILLTVSWLLEARETAVFFVVSNLALAGVVAAEYTGVLTYAPLFAQTTDLDRFFLDWRVVVGTGVNYTLVLAATTWLALSLRRAFRRRAAEQQALIEQLNDSLSRIRTLESLLPICAGCKKIRNENGTWDAMESYFLRTTSIRFSHCYCPDCAKAMEAEIERQFR
jgi:hypothetical protein